MSEDASTARRLARRFMLGSGPLKRASDRAEVLARVLLVTVVLTAVAVGLAVATATGTSTQSVADAQSASRYRVTATLTEDPAAGSGGSEHAGVDAAVTAQWTAPSGRAREGVIDVPVGARAGSTTSIWVDQEGDVTTRPLDGSDVAARAIVYGFSTFIGISALAVLAYLGLHSLLERSRLRRWAADWAVVEPVWSRKVP